MNISFLFPLLTKWMVGVCNWLASKQLCVPSGILIIFSSHPLPQFIVGLHVTFFFPFPLCVFIVCDCEECWAKCLKYVWSKEMSPRTWKQWGYHSNQSFPSIMPCRPVMSQSGYLSLCRSRTHWTRYKIYYYSICSHGGWCAFPIPFLSVCLELYFEDYITHTHRISVFYIFLILGVSHRGLTFPFRGCVCSSKWRMPSRMKWTGCL